MQLALNPSDGVPIYLQLVQQVKFQVATGRLQPGEQLPSVRKLSETLVINPNTVVKAYRELEVLGLVTMRHGAGAFIADGAAALSRPEQHQQFVQRLDQLLVEARHLSYSQDDVLQLVRQRFRRPPEPNAPSTTSSS